MPKRKPAVPLTRYQRRWIKALETMRFLIYLKARQIGITWATMLGLVLMCAGRQQTWYYLSKGERQAKEALAEARIHAEALRHGVKLIDEPYVWNDKEFYQLTLVFPNGSRIHGLPANPDTARGSHGNVVLDEFAHHKDAREIWRALAGCITRGYKLIVQSTPAGKRGKFYELWGKGSEDWQRHKTDIHQAVRDGMVGHDGRPIDIETLRRAIGTDDDD
ncbi:MAG: terminase large subunit domain-containing protein, partial [Alphaproteobacteria bacterium]